MTGAFRSFNLVPFVMRGTQRLPPIRRNQPANPSLFVGSTKRMLQVGRANLETVSPSPNRCAASVSLLSDLFSPRMNVFAIEIERCRCCGGRVEVIAIIEELV